MSDAAEITFESVEWERILKKVREKWVDIDKRKEFGGIVSATVFQDVMKHFDEEKGPDGGWKDWSTAYKKHLQKIGRSGNKILHFDGRLRQSFTPENWRGNKEGILFYNNAKTKGGYAYAKGHDEGGTVKGRPPMRKFMWLSNEAQNAIAERVALWILED